MPTHNRVLDTTWKVQVKDGKKWFLYAFCIHVDVVAEAITEAKAKHPRKKVRCVRQETFGYAIDEVVVPPDANYKYWRVLEHLEE